MTPDQPRQIGRYLVEALVGRGAMGVIYRAHDPEIDRTLAIKLVAAALLEGADAAEYLDRFRREARASGRCSHPNIVAVHDFGLHEGRPFLAMEFVEGMSLQAAVSAGRRFTLAEAARILGQVLDALDCAHAAGIVHRDIKPANILVLPDLRVKVADFGIARFGDSSLTQLGNMVGTPAYMSPEQCRGEAVDGRTDLFSAAAVLHELLTGGRAFGGGSVVEVIRRVMEAEPPPLPPPVAALAPGLPSVLARALAKRPEERFASAAEMAAALRGAVSGSPLAAGDDHTVLWSPDLPPPAPGGAAAEPAASGAGLTALLGSGLVDRAAISGIERSLANYVGPIAPMLVRSAIRRADSLEGLCEALAESIVQPEERRRFRAEATQRLSGGMGAASLVGRQTGTGRTGGTAAGPAAAATAVPAVPGAPPATEVELEAVRAALAPHIGPMARILVRRAAEGGTPAAAVWDRVARHIDRESERAQFLRKRTA